MTTVTEERTDTTVKAEGVAHLRCFGADNDHKHAICGSTMKWVAAPPDAEHCPKCAERSDLGGAISAWCDNCMVLMA